MLDMEDNIYRNKNAVKAVIGMIKTMNKVNKIREEEEKRFQPEIEEYKASKEYKQMIEELKKKDEDEDNRNDYDPKGYDLYQNSVNLLSYHSFSLKTQLLKLTNLLYWLQVVTPKLRNFKPRLSLFS